MTPARSDHCADITAVSSRRLRSAVHDLAADGRRGSYGDPPMVGWTCVRRRCSQQDATKSEERRTGGVDHEPSWLF